MMDLCPLLQKRQRTRQSWGLEKAQVRVLLSPCQAGFDREISIKRQQIDRQRCEGRKGYTWAVTTDLGTQYSKLQNRFNVNLLSCKMPNLFPSTDTLALVMCCFFSPWKKTLSSTSVMKHTVNIQWYNLFLFPVLLNIQAIGKCFLMLPGNKILDPEVRIPETISSSSLMMFSWLYCAALERWWTFRPGQLEFHY